MTGDAGADRPIPVGTYRFQLTPEFGFAAVGRQLDRLVTLGVSHVYLSPIAEAVPGSEHGYDVVDHRRVRHAFGGEDGFEALLDAAAGHGLAVIIDHVPNHMAADPVHNPNWRALLADGPGSAADDWFDVDWPAGGGQVILPILDAPLAEVVDAGDVRLDEEGTAIVVDGMALPVATGTSVPGDLSATLAGQHYRLQFWDEPDRNLRRFFMIDGLVGVRVEIEAVAEVVDTIPVAYAHHPAFAGVRIDHIDGLADPARYLATLRARLGAGALVYVEKIVVPGEWLPADWPVDGTTGYEFMRAADQVMIAAPAEEPFDRFWTGLAGEDALSFHEMELEAKREVADGGLAPDLARVDRVAAEALAEVEPSARFDELRSLATELDRYRTYLPDDPVAATVIGSVADGPVAGEFLDPRSDAGLELRTRWQQLTGPIMAKGAEDRAFYRYLRLASLCEVGGSPGIFGIDVDAFHDEAIERHRRWPRSMLAASTHDTKRSADVRARSAALTWRVAREPRAVMRLRNWVDDLVSATDVHPVDAWLALQTVICTVGLDAERHGAYILKAAREAELRTSWAAPDHEYEAALVECAHRALDIDVSPLQLGTLAAGISLARRTLHLTAPGVADIYQGTETLSYRLVDPDNRVPPDWAALGAAGALDATVASLWADGDDRCMTVLIRELLHLRRRRAASFDAASPYEPIDVGPGAIAYRRGDDVVVLVRRGAAFVDTSITLPEGVWHDVADPSSPGLWGESATASIIGSDDDGTLPVAILERD